MTYSADIHPITDLRKYITMTTSCVSTPEPVFIASRKLVRRARLATIGHWIKDTLKAVGVDTEGFTGHSTRSATTSQEYEGYSIPVVVFQ